MSQPATKDKSAAAATAKSQTKSGIKSFKNGEILFNVNDVAESLFIIQKGQVRLFLPKGRGFVEIAILRPGEVIGEMAYFDEKSRKRSCSASAIVDTDVVEISFNAFGKAMEGLNPWFKTIINTLAERLRQSNVKVKSLESNSVSFGADGKVSEYIFLHNVDIVKFLSLFYMITKSHGDLKGSVFELHISKLKFYFLDIFNFQEIKFIEFLQLLKNEGVVSTSNDENGLANNIQVSDVEFIRQLLVFFNTQRVAQDDKRLVISDKCEKFLQKIIEQVENIPGAKDVRVANISTILDFYKDKNLPMTIEDLDDALKAGLIGSLVVGENKAIITELNYPKLRKMFPAIKIMNAIKRLNESKVKKGNY